MSGVLFSTLFFAQAGSDLGRRLHPLRAPVPGHVLGPEGGHLQRGHRRGVPQQGALFCGGGGGGGRLLQQRGQVGQE